MSRLVLAQPCLRWSINCCNNVIARSAGRDAVVETKRRGNLRFRYNYSITSITSSRGTFPCEIATHTRRLRLGARNTGTVRQRGVSYVENQEFTRCFESPIGV